MRLEDSQDFLSAGATLKSDLMHFIGLQFIYQP